MTTRRVSVTFNGLPSVRTLRDELTLAARFVPSHVQIASLYDNHSADPDLREITFNFEWDGYQQ